MVLLTLDAIDLMYSSDVNNTHSEEAPSNETPALRKDKYEYLVCWYNKSTLYKRFLNCNKLFTKIKKLLAKLRSLS